MADEGLPDSQESFSDVWSVIDTKSLENEINLPEIIAMCEKNSASNGLNEKEHVAASCSLSHGNCFPCAGVPTDGCSWNSNKESLCRLDFHDEPGAYGFQINFGPQTQSPPKSTHYTYSYTLSKWFVKMDEVCPVLVRCSSSPPPGTLIRVTPVYKQAEFVNEVVTRCIHHRYTDKTTHIAPSHLIRAEMKSSCEVKYSLPCEKRESVCIVYQPPEVGSEFMTLLYKFMCLSSCRPGINKKALAVIFTLESPGEEVLGRRVIDLKISTCPGRDRTKAENDMRAIPSGKRVVKTEKRKREPDSEDNEVFWLKIEGRERYEMLRKINEAFVFSDRFKLQNSFQ